MRPLWKASAPLLIGLAAAGCSTTSTTEASSAISPIHQHFGTEDVGILSGNVRVTSCARVSEDNSIPDWRCNTLTTWTTAPTAKSRIVSTYVKEAEHEINASYTGLAILQADHENELVYKVTSDGITVTHKAHYLHDHTVDGVTTQIPVPTNCSYNLPSVDDIGVYESIDHSVCHLRVTHVQ
ncbi:hypothetical protein [Aliagarivorans taiwanensis]|uniref:hypothetical protein n=1 Tax=Aliagarivorans taiwanensis TaxID=561966 RepID=UPI00047A244D|nr:hypothetical protein [Aliagarivorans taiwanensis]